MTKYVEQRGTGTLVVTTLDGEIEQWEVEQPPDTVACAWEVDGSNGLHISITSYSDGLRSNQINATFAEGQWVSVRWAPPEPEA